MYKLRPLFNRTLFIYKSAPTFGLNRGNLSSKNTEINPEDEPIKYTTSPAFKYKAETTRKGFDDSNRPRYEPYVIIGSLAIFMVYFTMIREENDIDENLNRSLYSRIKGLEEQQLRLSLEYNREHNLDTKDIVERLEQIRLEKERGTYQN